MKAKKTKFAVIDLETTGFNPKKDEILSLGIIPMTGLRIDLGESVYLLLKPKKFKISSMIVHGLDPKVLRDAQEFAKIADEVLKMLEGRTIVGHSVNFDCKFLEQKFRDFKRIKLENYYKNKIDIAILEMVLAKFLGEPVNFENLTLDALAGKYGITISFRHNALADAFLTAQIFQMQLLRVLKYGIDTLESLISMQNSISKELRNDL
ncbi:MAG: 3'-5' exonuclease [Archaeoglobaceae archaeon]|nr:3'-5' exonuclease [Archaeoglobales archaeon]